MIAFLLDHSAKKYLVHEKTQRQWPSEISQQMINPFNPKSD